jgi:uncharacterized protein with HEPN domain
MRTEIPVVPRKLIAGTRDKLIHSYEGMDLEEIWKNGELGSAPAH